MTIKEEYMRRALEIARKGMGKVAPNPMVGCVIVKNGEIIGQGYHERYGHYHAERAALINMGEECKGADLYVTLEPCCHHGKTPPCTDIIIKKGIKRVFVGCLDPNPLIAGKGIQILRENNIEVVTGILEEECLKLNEMFFYYITKKRPYVALKYAMTLDGKIATCIDDSKWVTNEKSREDVHRLRNEYHAIMVGINTVLADDPMLNCRIPNGTDPVRIICDSRLRIPLDSNIVKTSKDIETIVVYCLSANSESYYNDKVEALEEKGVKLMCTDSYTEVDLDRLMDKLGERKISSILVEGGGSINGTLLTKGIVNKVYAYIAPKLVGGVNAKSPIEGRGIELMDNAVKLKNISMVRFGDDIKISGEVINCLQE